MATGIEWFFHTDMPEHTDLFEQIVSIVCVSEKENEGEEYTDIVGHLILAYGKWAGTQSDNIEYFESSKEAYDFFHSEYRIAFDKVCNWRKSDDEDPWWPAALPEVPFLPSTVVRSVATVLATRDVAEGKARSEYAQRMKSEHGDNWWKRTS
jgi:hypothetical protein